MGLHSVREVLKIRPRAVTSLWLRKNYEDSEDLKELAAAFLKERVKIDLKSPELLNRFTTGHQGVGVLVREVPVLDWARLEGEEPCQVLILDGVEDPHNLGAILRTSWLLGVQALFAPEVRATGLTPTACKVASGGAEHVPLVMDSSLPQVIERLKELGFWVYGLAAEGEQSLWQLKLEGKVAWVLGSEEKGLRKPVARSCDELISIPQKTFGASYNVSVAAAMALAETARQFQI
jgi:23S rRNA (guanosine2251-2'-O)-methyltransferase